MKVTKTKIHGVLVLDLGRFYYKRGFFSETWSQRTFEKVGLKIDFVQDNHPFSLKARILRGLNFQYHPAAQLKLVRCGKGKFLDVVVDIRRGSPTIGDWLSETLSFDNGK